MNILNNVSVFSIKIPNNIFIFIGPKWILIKTSNNILLKTKELHTLLFFKNNRLFLLNKTENNVKILSRLTDWITNIIIPHRIQLKFKGVGFKIEMLNKQNILKINLGQTHPILYQIPIDIKFYQPKAKTPIYFLEGANLEKLMKIATDIKKFKNPDPYKNKGVRIGNEKLIKKAGKKNNV